MCHVSLRISKIVKLSGGKYIKTLPGFLYNWVTGSHTRILF